MTGAKTPPWWRRGGAGLASPDGLVLDASGRVTAVVEAKVTSGGEPRPIDDNYLLQVLVQCACVGVDHGYFASLGKRQISVQRVDFDPDVWDEDLQPILGDFYALRATEFVSNLLPGQDAAFLRQVIKDYRDRHVSAPRLHAHGLQTD